MRHFTRPIVFIVALLCGSASFDLEGASKVIPLSQLEEMFHGMRTGTRWNVDGDLLWGYFFLDPKRENLLPLREHLVQAGYHLADLYQADDKSTYVLHVERVETHSPATLFRRNTELEALAVRFGVATYDGMDVGLAPMAVK
jgi:Regulator of ribonuclease activity B